MGFYGNITNENKTTFKFDRTYANRYLMDEGAKTDGVYPGRYVLVDYDQPYKQSDYPIDPGKPYWLYHNVLYTAGPKIDTLQTFDFYVGTYQDSVYPIKSISKGTVIRLEGGRVIDPVNPDETLYIRVGGIIETEEFSRFQGVQLKTDIEKSFYEYWVVEKEFSFSQVDCNKDTYKQGFYFIKNNRAKEDYERYIICTDLNFNEEESYYSLVGPKGESIPYAASSNGITDQANIYVSNTRAIVTGDIVMIPPKYAYNFINTPQFIMAQDYLYDDAGGINGIVWERLGGDEVIDLPVSNSTVEQYPAHYINYLVDRNNYKSARRGYDSTVWQKVIRDNQDEYVMIAELNSVVPTFDIEADAPTEVPTAPHFDANSTTVYYKIHMQPQWGLRTKAADERYMLPKLNTKGEFASGKSEARILDQIRYPSDQKVLWTRQSYDKMEDSISTSYYDAVSGAWATEKSEDTEFDAAIYFNKDGFDFSKISYSSDLIDKLQSGKGYNKEIADHGWKDENKIELTPTGRSGVLYNKHDGTVEKESKEDIQELSIMLPAIGNSVAAMWDLIYGGRDTNLEIAKTNLRNTDIAWEHARGHLNRNGLRLTGGNSEANQYNAYNENFEINTLAGCINSAHDLMGMIINPDHADNLTANLSNLNVNQIFYVKPAAALATTPEAKALVDKAGGQYVMKALTYEFEPIGADDYKFETIVPEDTNFDKTQYWVSDGAGGYRPATNEDEGPFYIQTVAPEVTYPPVELTPFDGTVYYYKDVNSDAIYAEDDPLKQDYISEPEYHEGIDYYTFAQGQPVKIASLSGNYEPGKYYLKQANGSFYLDMNESSTLGKTYYEIDEGLVRNIRDNQTKGSTFKTIHQKYDGIYVPGKYYYKDEKTNTYHVDMTPTGTIIDGSKVMHYGIMKTSADDESNPVYILQVTYLPISYENVYQNEYDGVPDSINYYILVNNKYEPVDKSTDWLNQETQYFTRSESYVQVSGSVVIDEGRALNLTPYALNTFYKKEYDDYGEFKGYKCVQPEDITGESNQEDFYAFGYNADGGIYPFTIAETDWKNPDYEYAVSAQSDFYTPHEYHYQYSVTKDGKTYNSYLLDNYLTKTHEDYYEFTVAPSKVDIKFYDPYKYYVQNSITGEWELAVGEFDENKTYAEKETYYVISDESGIFEEGAEWNPNVTNVPPGVTLGRRTEKYEFRVLEGFARNLNTLHGLILKINQVLLSNDKLTRDKRTVQGVINQLNDMIAQFGKLIPGQLALVDNYGRFHSSDWETLQAETASATKTSTNTYAKGVVEDRYPEVASVDLMRKQWLTLHTDASISEPKITIHHNFQPVTSSTPTLDLNGSVALSGTDNTDQISLYVPIVDAMGHVVGSNVTKVTLPYGFKYFTTTGQSNATSQLTTSQVQVVADSTKDTFAINPGNKWIRMATNANTDSITIAHEIHTPETAAIADTDLDTVQTFTVQDTQFDAAGHITHNQQHTYKLPDGFKFVEIGEASAEVSNGATGAGILEADSQVAKFSIVAGNRWITLNANADTDTLTLGHAYAGTASQYDKQAENQEPQFGATFNIPYNGFDEAGHLSVLGNKTVKIPLPFLNTAEGDVVTGLSLVPETGAFTMTKANVGTLKITDYLEGADAGYLVNTDSINAAFGKLQVQMKNEVKAREDAIKKEVEDRNTAITDAVNTLDVEDTALDGQYVSQVSETDGKIAVSRKELPTVTDSAVDGEYVSAVTQAKGEIKVERKALPTVEDVAENDQYVASVKQTNGAIEVERKALSKYTLTAGETTGTLKLVDSQAEENPEVTIPGLEDMTVFVKTDSTFEYNADAESIENTIQWLFAKVAALEARISQLENPVTDETTPEEGTTPTE